MNAPDNSIRAVEEHMGTIISLQVHDTANKVVDRFFNRIRELEALLSRFRPDSQVSLIADGLLRQADSDPAVLEVLSRCSDLRYRTEGCFEYEPQRQSSDPADPILDPNAVAKGWIVNEAAAVLKDAGVREFFINAGGDVLASRPRLEQPWRVGVQHPDDPGAVIAIFGVSHGAVATSGAYERGQHIRSAQSSRLKSVTVVGPDLAEADGLATAVLASGQPLPGWWNKIDHAYGLLTMSAADHLRWDPPTLTSNDQEGPTSSISLISQISEPITLLSS